MKLEALRDLNKVEKVEPQKTASSAVDADSRWEQMFREQMAREAEEQKKKDQDALKKEIERMREIVR
jgi:hypothetical protein